MAQSDGTPKGELRGKQELGEALPPSSQFKDKLDMARKALSVADQAGRLLSEEITRANAKLEGAGKLSRTLSVKTPDYFLRVSDDEVGKPFIYRGYAFSTQPRFQEVTGIFEGLTVIDTQTVEYPAHKLAMMRDEQPDRLIICGAFSNPEEPEATKYVPYQWLEGPEHAMENIIGSPYEAFPAGIGRNAMAAAVAEQSS